MILNPTLETRFRRGPVRDRIWWYRPTARYVSIAALSFQSARAGAGSLALTRNGFPAIDYVGSHPDEYTATDLQRREPIQACDASIPLANDECVPPRRPISAAGLKPPAPWRNFSLSFPRGARGANRHRHARFS
jgi:hypothetical protein